MTKKKTTKRALLMSALSLMMCVTMFVGSTFAWFTDEVTSGNNKIIAGNLDIELEYHNGSEWKTVNGATDLFSKELWEPGHTEVVYLKLSNLGSLALKYQLGINVVSEKGGTNVADAAFKLSDYICMGVVENVEPTYSSREAAIEAAKGGANGIIGNGYTKSGSMNADAEELYMAVVVYMPETVGNEANHKSGTDAPEINLGINLIATQLTKEIDSFGPDYDEDAGIYSVVVTSEAELVAALSEAKNGDIIGISGNVTWTTGAEIGSTPFVTDATYITLKGVDENATFTAIGSGVGPVGIDNGTVIFKNLKIVDESVSYAENNWEYGYLEFRGNTVFENCDVVNAIMMEGTSAKFVDCSFNSYDDNQYAVWVSDGDTSFENCYFTGARGIKIHEAYGSEVDTVVIDNNTFAVLTKKPGVAIGTVNADTSISIINNMFAGTQPGDQGNYKYESDTDVATFGFVDENNTVVEATSDSNELKKAIQNGETHIWLVAGNYIMPTDVSLKGKNLTIKGTEETVIDVSNVDERNQFVTGANLTFEGVTLNFGTKNYMGFANTASLTYKDCTINGLQFFYGSGTTSFVNCALNSNGAEHCAWTWGGQNISFTDCDFTYGDRAVNCYGENVTTNVSFTNCTFTKVSGKDITGAIETNSSTLTALNLTINNCSVNEGDLWWVSTWDSKGGANTYTTVDGKVTVGTAKQLAAVVGKGATDITLMDGEYNVENCGGKTLTISGTKDAVLKVMNEGEDGCDYGFGSAETGVGDFTFNGVTIDTTENTGNYKGYAYMKGTFNDCNFVGAYSLNNANDFVFNRCTFDFKDGYFWTWGANSVTFKECTFGGNSKNILAHGWASTVININSCKFAATEMGYAGGGTIWTAAVEIDPAGTNTYTINFTGENTINENYNGWTRVKDDSTGHTITGLN